MLNKYIKQSINNTYHNILSNCDKLEQTYNIISMDVYRIFILRNLIKIYKEIYEHIKQ